MLLVPLVSVTVGSEATLTVSPAVPVTSNPAADVVPDTTTRFVQGSVEASNVNAVAEVTRLMQMQQAYQRAVNLVNSDDELTKNLLGRLGRPA